MKNKKTFKDQLALSEEFRIDKDEPLRFGPNGCNQNMNRIFAEWLNDHIHENSRRGDAARMVRDQNITIDDAAFPKWSDYESLAEPVKRRSTKTKRRPI